MYSHNARPLSPLPLVVLLTGVLACLSPWIPPTTYWRDAGEFIITAFFLDVTHPPGSPIYSQLANLCALLPIGPIAFRVNVFSAICLASSVAVSCYLAYILIRDIVGLKGSLSLLISTIPAVILLLSPATLRQGLTAEVYSLNTLFILLILLGIVRYQQTRDCRVLVLTGFIAGLGMGNHASVLFAAGLAALGVILAARPPAGTVVLTITGAVIGLFAYGYVPARALTHPPMNSGYAVTPLRLWNHLTDARDRHLRSGPSLGPHTPEKSTAVLPAIMESIERGPLRDLTRAAQDIGLGAIILGLLGGIGLVLIAPLIGVTILSLGLGIWIFFAGWDPDPWIPVFALSGILSSVALAILGSAVARRETSWGGIVTGTGFCTLLVGGVVNFPPEYLKSLRDLNLPVRNSLYTLQHSEPGSIVISEHSWFLLSYLQNIEGVRRDTTLIFQPNLIFPDLFTPVTLTTSTGQSAELSDFANLHSAPTTERTKNLGRFISFAAPHASLTIEPSEGSLSPLKNLLIPSDDGLLRVQYMKQGGEPLILKEPTLKRAKEFRVSIDALPAPLRSDARNYAETTLLAYAHYFSTIGRPQDAVAAISELCHPTPHYPCSTTTLNNLGVFMLRAGDPAEAQTLFLDLLANRRDKTSVLKENLKIAQERLNGVTDP